MVMNIMIYDICFIYGKHHVFCIAGAMSPGVPDTFAVNYTSAMRFLESIEAFCTSTAALTAFRGCAAYVSFNKRWRLSIYFSTRFQVPLEISFPWNSQLEGNVDSNRAIQQYVDKLLFVWYRARQFVSNSYNLLVDLKIFIIAVS